MVAPSHISQPTAIALPTSQRKNVNLTGILSSRHKLTAKIT
ncbi:hypothetical protein [Microcoleus sp. FACHB-SPT15]|nr:hypothetical protein [Microcoleus sp. FACHB-SPT15]